MESDRVILRPWQESDAETGLDGWLACYPKSRLAGTIFCGGVSEAKAIECNVKLQEAYELGKHV